MEGLGQAAASPWSGAVGAARVVLLRGDAARLIGDLAAAGDRYRDAADALAGLGVSAEAEARLKLGQMAAALGDPDAARLALEEALRLAVAAAHPGHEAAAYLALGAIDAGSGDAAGARRHWTRASELARGAGDLVGAGRARLELAGQLASDGEAAAVGEALAAAEALFRAAPSPMGGILAAVARGDVATAAARPAEAADAYRQAAAALGALKAPVAEANHFLGLPPVNRIDLAPATQLDDYNDGDELDPQTIARYEAAREANLAAHPDLNLEARLLLAEVEAGIAAGLAADD